MRRRIGRRHLGRQPHTGRDHLDRTSAKGLARVGERVRRGDDGRGAPEQRPRECRDTACELDIGSPELEHVRLPSRAGGEGGRQPVRMHDICTGGGTPSRKRIGRNEPGREHKAPWVAPQILDDSTSVRDPEMPEDRRRDDIDVDALPLDRCDGVRNEPTGTVVRVARI
jgi:hypothetical protein